MKDSLTTNGDDNYLSVCPKHGTKNNDGYCDHCHDYCRNEKTETSRVDFDDLVYLQLDHSPGYQQWWVMINLGRASVGDKHSIILQRFGNRIDAEQFKEDIRSGCLIKKKDKQHAKN